MTISFFFFKRMRFLRHPPRMAKIPKESCIFWEPSFTLNSTVICTLWCIAMHDNVHGKTMTDRLDEGLELRSVQRFVFSATAHYPCTPTLQTCPLPPCNCTSTHLLCPAACTALHNTMRFTQCMCTPSCHCVICVFKSAREIATLNLNFIIPNRSSFYHIMHHYRSATAAFFLLRC